MSGVVSLINELDECGFPGSRIANRLIDAYDGSTGLHELKFTMPVRPDDHLVMQFQFQAFPGRQFEVQGLDACLWSERRNRFAYPPSERPLIWQSFQGLPTIEEVLNRFERQAEQIQFIPINENLKAKTMNLNNLENLSEELKTLGFKDKTIAEMQQQMEKDVPEFTLHDSRQGTRGLVDMNLYFKQSSQSEHYFFNKYEVALNSGKALEEGQKYLIISPNPNEPNKNLYKSFENVVEAITFFKAQKGNSELAIVKGEGKDRDMDHRTKLATIENGKNNYVAKEFQRTFRTPAVTQTFYVEKGRGFNAEQAANLIQGRAVYRDDMANIAGETYKAWVKLDMDQPKDGHQNFYTNQYHDPAYGFNLEKVLDKFNIKELNETAQKEALETSLRNGNRPLVTVVKDGQEVKMQIEAVPRYSQVNLFAENGKPEKREQFLKEPLQEQTLKVGKVKGQEKEQGQGLSV
jgi:hypothetical protein